MGAGNLAAQLRDAELQHAKDTVKSQFTRGYTARTGKPSEGGDIEDEDNDGNFMVGDRIVVSHSHEDESIRGKHGKIESINRVDLHGKVDTVKVRLDYDSEDTEITCNDLRHQDDEELSRGDRIVVRRSHENAVIRGKAGKVKSIDGDKVKVRLDRESSDKEIERDDLRRLEVKGPFQTLAFDGLDESERVMITRESETSLYRYRNFFAIPVGCTLFVLAAGLWYGMFELMSADFEMDEVSFLGEQAESLFFPSKGCIKDSLLVIYGWLLMIVWMPAAIIGAVVWPLWLTSLQLGVALVADDVEDLMKELDPAGPVIPDPHKTKDGKDGKGKEGPMFQSSDSVLNTPRPSTPLKDLTEEQRLERQESRQAAARARNRENQRRKRKEELDEQKWEIQVALPGAMLVSTMEELSVWGPSMGFAFVGCICTALTLVPTAVAMESATMFAILVVIFFIPIQIAYAPANVSRLPSEPSSGALASSAFLSRRII